MITVSIIENDQDYRHALLSNLQKATDISVLFAVGSLSGLALLRKASPDVMIIDSSFGKGTGINEVLKIKNLFPNAKIIVLVDSSAGDAILQTLRTGAVGYLLKKNPPTNILDAVRRVSRGEAALSGVIARKILDYFQQPLVNAKDLAVYRLTKREQEVLELLMDGLSYKEIAARCFVSIDTINSHIRKLYRKLNVRSRGEITAKLRLK